MAGASPTSLPTTARPCPPVLLIVFNRPDTTAAVVDALRLVRPRRLYVAADGPRDDRPGEAQACLEARAAATRVDWPCEVMTLFRDSNVGCRRGVSEAIDWFFGSEREGAILEDDVVPTPGFFSFVAELLERYRDDGRISMIAGANFQTTSGDERTSYYFSRLHHVWGWATWRRAWAQYDRNMAGWPEFKRVNGFRSLGLGDGFARRYAPAFDAVAAGACDTWDYQWLFTGLRQNMLAVIPRTNLIRNIGFGPAATHTTDPRAGRHLSRVVELTFPLVHPELIIPNRDCDDATIARELDRGPWMSRVVGMARRVLRRGPGAAAQPEY
jgi:hypothetical protein